MQRYSNLVDLCSRELCGLYVRAANIGHTARRTKCAHWVGSLTIELLPSLTLHSAVLASFLLNEELGYLGRIGCGLCLIGSLIIVLHAPADKEVETVDEILHYAIQPGKLSLAHSLLFLIRFRIHAILPHCPRILYGHDFQCCPALRPLKSSRLHLDLLVSRFRVRYGYQRIRGRGQINLERQQPIHTSQYIRLRHCCGGMHFGADEFL